MSMNNPTYHLEGIIKDKGELSDFEGPLTLILTLLSKNKIEIRDIQISDILDQYVAHIAKMRETDLDVASEFVQMAAHLIFIKARTLLKNDDEEASELELLISSLEQLKYRDMYSGIKAVAPELGKASERGLCLGTKPPEPLPSEKRFRYEHECVDLLLALSSVVGRGRPLSERAPEIVIPKRIIYGVKHKSRELISLLRSGPKTLGEIYEMCKSRSEIVATFISVLELCSMGSLNVTDEGGGFVLSFVGGDLKEILDAIEE